MITDIIEALGHLFNVVWKVIGWLQRTWLTWLALLVSIVITPIQWALNTGLWFMDRLIAMVASLNDAIDALHIGSLGSFLSGASYFLSLADNFVPIGLVLGLVTALFALWVIVQTIKVSAWLFRRVWDLIP